MSGGTPQVMELIKMYHLKEFPTKIAEVETKILNLAQLRCAFGDREVNIYKEQLSFMDADIEAAISLPARHCVVRFSPAKRDRIR